MISSTIGANVLCPMDRDKILNLSYYITGLSLARKRFFKPVFFFFFFFFQVFVGNTDSETASLRSFVQMVFARAIRIRPQSWTNVIHVRMELLGCPIGNTRRTTPLNLPVFCVIDKILI